MENIDYLVSFLKKFYTGNKDDFYCNKIEEFKLKVKPNSLKKTKVGELYEYRLNSIFYRVIMEDNRFKGFSSFELDDKNKVIKGDLLKIKTEFENKGLASFLLEDLINFGKKLSYNKIIAEPDETYMPHGYFKKKGWNLNNSYMEYLLN